MEQQLSMKGLENTQNLCYANSLIQQLYAIEAFRSDVLSISSSPEKGSEKEMNEKEELVQHSMLKLKKVFRKLSMNGDDDESISLKSFYKEVLKALTMDKRLLKEMRDVSEFFSEIIKICLVYTRRGVDYRGVISDFPNEFLQGRFSGKLLQVIKPENLPAEYNAEIYKALEIIRPEPFYYISLNLNLTNPDQYNEKTTLLASLDQYVQPRKFQFRWKLEPLALPPTISGSNSAPSPAISSPSPPASQQFLLPSVQYGRILEFPDHLIFYIRRFRFNSQTQSKEKLCQPLSFPLILDMSPYCVRTEDNSADIISEQESSQYCLTGMLLHLGDDTTEGHYVSLVRKTMASSLESNVLLGSEWVLYDDERVEEVTLKEEEDVLNHLQDINGVDEEVEQDHQKYFAVEEVEENIVMLFYRRN
jgi:hypothetical protein